MIMSIPYSDNIRWNSYTNTPNWYTKVPVPTQNMMPENKNSVQQIVHKIFIDTFKELYTRGVQCLRDSARLILKEPIRSVWTPIILSKNWKQRERVVVNAQLVGCSFVQLVYVPTKALMAIAALATLTVSREKALQLLDISESWSANLDGCASRLEALKTEGRGNAQNQEAYHEYKEWLFKIDAKLCRKES
jgi:hypothetical protein